MKKITLLSILLSLLLVTNIFAEENSAKIHEKFKDIPEGYWGSEAVKWALEIGAVSGYPDGTFRPNQLVTAGEWSAMIYRLFAKEDFPLDLKVRVKNEINMVEFLDVPKTHWAVKYCYFNHDVSNFIHMAGLKKCYADRPLMRWQALENLDRIYNGYGFRIEDPNEYKGMIIKGIIENRFLGIYDVFSRAKKEGKLFKDYIDPENDIDLSYFPMIDRRTDYWKRSAVDIAWSIYDLRFTGFLQGFEDNTLRPNEKISRIEALTLLYRLYPYIDREYMDEDLRAIVINLSTMLD